MRRIPEQADGRCVGPPAVCRDETWGLRCFLTVRLFRSLEWEAKLEGLISTFEEHKKGLHKEWTQKLKNLNEETKRFWTHIETGYLDFQRSKSSTR